MRKALSKKATLWAAVIFGILLTIFSSMGTAVNAASSKQTSVPLSSQTLNASTGRPDTSFNPKNDTAEAAKAKLSSANATDTSGEEINFNEAAKEDAKVVEQAKSDGSEVSIGVPSDEESAELTKGKTYQVKLASSAVKAKLQATTATLIYQGPNWFNYGGGVSRAGSFLVNGQRAFCSYHALATPNSGRNTSVNLSVPSGNLQNQILKILYYGYEGPGCTYTAWPYFSTRRGTGNGGIILTSLRLSQVVTGSYYQTNVAGMSQFINYLNSKPQPDFNAWFSNSTLTGYVDTNGNIRTNEVTVNGGNAAKVHFAVPSGTQLVTGGRTYNAGQWLTFTPGQKFYLVKTDRESNGESQTVGATRDSYYAIMWFTRPASWQNMSQLQSNPQSLSFKVQWPKLGRLTLHKTNKSGTNIQGATFELATTGSNGYDSTKSTDSSGNLTFTSIPDGTYTLKETYCPPDYFTEMTDYTVTVSNAKATIKDSKGNTISVTNSDNNNSANIFNYDKGKFSVIKYEYGSTSTKLQNAIFKLTGPDDYLQEQATDSNGQAVFTRLMPGTYTLTEESASKDHYSLSKDQKQWTVVVSKDADQNFSYVFKDSKGNKLGTTYATLSSVKAKKQSVKAKRQSAKAKLQTTLETYTNTVKGISANTNAASTQIEVPNRKTHEFKIHKTDTSGHNLAGAKFNLTAVDTGETYADAQKTDSTGYVTFTDIREGTYKLTENYAPTGYYKDKTVYTVVVTVNSIKVYDESGNIVNLDSSGNVNSTEVTLKNRPKAQLQIKKTEDGSGTLLQGATFMLTKDGTTTSWTKTTQSTGLATFKNLDDGNYTLRETRAPENYIRLSKVINVTVDRSKVSVNTNDQSNVTTEKDSEGSVICIDVANTKVTPKTGTFGLRKIDQDTGKTITGAVWTLYKYDITGTADNLSSTAPCNLTSLNNDTTTKAYTTMTADANGEATVSGLTKGIYLIKETTTPNNYFTMVQDSALQENAPFAVYVDSDANVTVYKQCPDGTSFDGRFADQYKLDMSDIKDQVPIYTYDNKKYPDIKIKKRDRDTKAVLPNVTFTLTSKTNTSNVKTATTDSNGTLTFENVPAGSYILQETKKPSGYQDITEKWYLTVDVNGNVTFTES